MDSIVLFSAVVIGAVPVEVINGRDVDGVVRVVFVVTGAVPVEVITGRDENDVVVIVFVPDVDFAEVTVNGGVEFMLNIVKFCFIVAGCVAAIDDVLVKLGAVDVLEDFVVVVVDTAE